MASTAPSSAGGWAARRGTLAWRLHPDYTQHLAESDCRRFDWTKAQRLRGVALALWMVFTSPRVPYRPVFETREELEVVEVPLTPDHCHALGVRAGADAARRRTFNDAGLRVVDADRSFVAFEAHGGRRRDSFLRVIRRRPTAPPLDRPLEPRPAARSHSGRPRSPRWDSSPTAAPRRARPSHRARRAAGRQFVGSAGLGLPTYAMGAGASCLRCPGRMPGGSAAR